MVDVATPFPIVKEETTMDDPTNVENKPLFRFRVEILEVDTNSVLTVNVEILELEIFSLLITKEEALMVEATPFPIVKEETTIDDPTILENNPLFRLSVEIPMVDAI